MARKSTRGAANAAKGKATAQSDPPVPKTGRRSTRSHDVVFSFLKLPVEVRIQIYEYALPEKMTCREVNKCERNSDEPCFFESSDALHPGDGCRGYTALLCTCKEIYEEAVDILYSSTRSHTNKFRAGQVLIITDDEITIRNYSMFCRRHLMYRTDVSAFFFQDALPRNQYSRYGIHRYGHELGTIRHAVL
ncbi:uncharacterized protein K452DRAFT_93867 [Aplosporella prunicola CBS 121167]|uniref:DUF7730 domain-containing protein n=1 Tax=Aplosporella prunicola CBS 121167 TaxID=1176127 RepID=A0A6A6B431_9PEZI|nr:uncharacterized protein K452DRAFT_93867 [Aplosporella prunicola CBS 121167]KAF2138015.1 hypothetical protein K452DRAFT_93867 [Aplosporella prunicola CBS 121167]